ncbi:hypothetical protein SLA2020_234110 [Shorea laevis]
MENFSKKSQVNDRGFNYRGREFSFLSRTDSNSSLDIELEFLEDGVEVMPVGISSDENETLDGSELDDEEKENGAGSAEENKSFWESQHQLLTSTLNRSSSLELKIRSSVKETLKEIQRTGGTVCACRKPASGSCKSCFMKEVSHRLQNTGFNCAVCRSKWRTSPNIPSGEHTFLDLIENSTKGEVRVIIELNFRAEFEMARASEEYNRLVEQLPEVFVGKVERLMNAIKILCSAAKKCMKERKIHMGPWRKKRYMQAKWLSASERTTSLQPFPAGYSRRLQKPKASMLTVDLLEKMPNMHRTAVAVI